MPNPITCRCGAVALNLTGEPAARAYCHCATCRDFYGTPVLAATAWRPERAVVASGTPRAFRHPERQLTKHFCAGCGETLYGVNRLGMHVVPNSLVARAAGGTLPEALRPVMHLFYRERVVDVRDGLVKYLDGWDGPLHEE